MLPATRSSTYVAGNPAPPVSTYDAGNPGDPVSTYCAGNPGATKFTANLPAAWSDCHPETSCLRTPSERGLITVSSSTTPRVPSDTSSTANNRIRRCVLACYKQGPLCVGRSDIGVRKTFCSRTPGGFY